jgi:hypothetical protein
MSQADKIIIGLLVALLVVDVLGLLRRTSKGDA